MMRATTWLVLGVSLALTACGEDDKKDPGGSAGSTSGGSAGSGGSATGGSTTGGSTTGGSTAGGSGGSAGTGGSAGASAQFPAGFEASFEATLPERDAEGCFVFPLFDASDPLWGVNFPGVLSGDDLVELDITYTASRPNIYLGGRLIDNFRSDGAGRTSFTINGGDGANNVYGADPGSYAAGDVVLILMSLVLSTNTTLVYPINGSSSDVPLVTHVGPGITDAPEDAVGFQGQGYKLCGLRVISR